VVPLGSKVSAGQVPVLPSQVSPTSQLPPAGRQENPDALKVSLGHVVADPLQVSATSQLPTVARQVVPLALRLVKQVPDALHVSGSSHKALEGSPQAVPEALNTSTQAVVVPEQ
jgi:hypothetical protein